MGRAMITHEEEEYSLSHEVACEQMLVEEKEVVKRHLRLDRAQRHVVVLLRDRGDEAVLVRRAAGLQAREGKLRVVAVHLVPGELQKLARILHADVAVAVAVFAHKGFRQNVAALLLSGSGGGGAFFGSPAWTARYSQRFAAFSSELGCRPRLATSVTRRSSWSQSCGDSPSIVHSWAAPVMRSSNTLARYEHSSSSLAAQNARSASVAFSSVGGRASLDDDGGAAAGGGARRALLLPPPLALSRRGAPAARERGGARAGPREEAGQNAAITVFTV